LSPRRKKTRARRSESPAKKKSKLGKKAGDKTLAKKSTASKRLKGKKASKRDPDVIVEKTVTKKKKKSGRRLNVIGGTSYDDDLSLINTHVSSQVADKVTISFFARAGERTRNLLFSFIFSFHHFTPEPQRLPLFKFN
jgi:hypothetical protein